MTALRYSGELAALTTTERTRLLNRQDATLTSVREGTTSIIADVKARGDDALLDLARRVDHVELTSIEVSLADCRRALHDLAPDLRAALTEAAGNIRAFHHAQLPREFELEVSPGVRLGRRNEPLGLVGVYVPGGRANYPSTVLMGVIPARVAGVHEVIVCSPPGPDGKPPAMVMAACALAGASRLFALGGAGAVAAMAYGTATVPAVDKVLGPGNAWVNEAKQQLNGVVAIDNPAGPSEVLVIADETADPRLAVLDLLAQAEHDPNAAAVLVTVGADLARRALEALDEELAGQPREAIIRESLADNGAVLSAGSLGEALTFANDYAPEHLLLMVAEPRAALDQVRNAGTVFLGNYSSVAFGDYVTGANHTLPTAGLARSYSGLSTNDFLRQVTYQELSPAAAARLAPVVRTLATAEGLPAHAAAAAGRADAARAGDAGTSSPEPGQPRHFRAAFREFAPYVPVQGVPVSLNDNTNLFGAGPAALAALAAVAGGAATAYPEAYAETLRAEIARLHGVAPENVTTGTGLDGVIDATLRAYCEPGALVAHPEPTFGMPAIFAKMNGARTEAVPVTADGDVDVDGLLAVAADVIYVCDPNNPTGLPVTPARLDRLIAEAPGLVLLDEAYREFAERSLVPTGGALKDRVPDAVKPGSNLLVLRTFSKAYGLAGLRVGYAIGAADLIAEIEKSRGPYRLSGPSAAVATAALRNGQEWMRDVVRRSVENRDRLTAELRQRGLAPVPSVTNFVLVPVAGTHMARPGGEARNPAVALADALQERGVAVRSYSDLPGYGPALRVSVGPWPLLERFLAALDIALSDAAGPVRSAAGSGGQA